MNAGIGALFREKLIGGADLTSKIVNIKLSLVNNIDNAPKL
jgi:hypothetical protein